MGKTLEVVLKAVDKASSVFKQVGQAGEDAGKKAGSGFSFRQLNRDYKKTELSSFLKLAHGGGAALAVSMIGASLAEVTGKINEMDDAWKKGNVNAADMFQTIGEGLPVIGGFMKAGANLSEAIFGTKAKAAAVELLATIQNTSTDASTALSRALKSEVTKQDLILNFRMNLVGKEGFLLESAKAENERIHQIDEVEAQRKAIIESIDDANKPVAANLKLAQDSAVTQAQNIIPLHLSPSVNRQEILDAVNKASKMSQDAIDDNENKLRSDKLKATTDLDGELTQLKAVQAAEEQARLRTQLEACNRIIQKYSDDTKSIYQSTAQIVLRANHDFLGAELAQLKQQTEAKKAEIDKQLAEQLKVASPEMQEKMKAEAAANKAAIDAEANANRGATENNAVYDARLQILQTMADAGDAQAKAQIDMLNSAREEYELRRKMQTIIEDPKATSYAKAAAQKNLSDLAAADKDRVKNSLRDGYNSALEAQAEFGATAADREQAKRDLEKQKILKEAKERKAELDKIQNDPAATGAQKQLAQENFQAWKAQQASRFDKETGGGGGSNYKAATLEETHHLTGMAQQAEQKADADADKASGGKSEDANKLWTSMDKNLEAIAKWTEKQDDVMG